jgi:signal transduction histidine kinase
MRLGRGDVGEFPTDTVKPARGWRGAIAPALGWFGPPTLASPDASRRARAVWMLAWSFLAILTVLLAAAVMLQPETLAARATSTLAVAALVVVLHTVNRRGRTNLASWIFVLGLTAAFTQRAWATGGVHAPIAVFYVLFVLMAAGLLGTRGSLVTASACMAGAILLTVGGMTGSVGTVSDASTIAVDFLVIILAIAATLVALTLLLHQAKRSATDDLIQMFVHDMRSPLTVIVARLGLLREDAPDDSATAEHVDAACADALRLTQLANNFLDIHRLDAGRMPIRRTSTDVGELARDVVRALRVLDPTRHMDVRTSSPASCKCDPEIVRRVLENLVSNAIKHTPRQGTVRIHVATYEAGVRVAVEDEGAGVPAGTRSRIFEKFGAAAARKDHAYHSVGLGLAFCKLAVEAHGGSIGVADAVPHGAIFAFVLPK